MRKLIRKGSLVSVERGFVYIGKEIPGRRLFLTFRSIYERQLILNDLQKIPSITWIYVNFYRPFWRRDHQRLINRRKSRKIYILPKRNRIHLSKYQGDRFMCQIQIIFPLSRLPEVGKSVINILSRHNFIPGWLVKRNHVKNCLMYRFKADLEYIEIMGK